MKKLMLGTAVVSSLGLAGAPAWAGAYGDLATVVETRPVYERVSVPREQCWVEPVTAYETRRVVEEVPTEPYYGGGSGAPGAIVGAIIGGVIGHQFGNSSGGRDRATAAGALLGGLAGYGASRGYDAGPYAARQVVRTERVPVTQDVRRCRTVSEASERVVGYDVRYLYDGREFTTRMAADPGPTLRVNVDVHPDGPGPSAYATQPVYAPPGYANGHRLAPRPVAPIYSRAGY